MKKIRNLLVVLLTVILLFSSTSLLFSSKVFAEDGEEATEGAGGAGTSQTGEGTGTEGEEQGAGGGNINPDEIIYTYDGIYARTSNKFEFNASELLVIYAKNMTGGSEYPDYRHNIKQGELIDIMGYNKNGERYIDNTASSTPRDAYHDGFIDSMDSSFILGLSQVGLSMEEYRADVDQVETSWHIEADDIIWSLVNYYKKAGKEVAFKDVVLVADSHVPEIEEFNLPADSLTIKSNEKISAETLNKINKLTSQAAMINAQIWSGYSKDYFRSQTITSITVTPPDGSEWKMVLGTDNNWYLLRTKDAQKEFETDLSYRSESENKAVEGKMDGSTYLPPYYENEDKNAKKDADAYAIIKSKTNEDIVATNGVAMKDDGTANSEGWYYKDVNDKKVIEKIYPFDAYNNPKDNGAVKETVKLTGRDGGEDSETPDIRWTLRRINYDEKTNKDGSITVTITYNLPIDEKSVPEGWKVIVDEDGGIRRIQRTFKPGEDYDKDVTVEQNGPSKATVTTPVKIRWHMADKKIPQAGLFTFATVAVVAGVAIFSITRYRKLNK